MPLSDHEQRLLEQMERALYAEDPKFASALRGADPRAHYRRRILVASVGFVVGIVGLMTGLVSQVIWISIVGFVLMLASAFFALSSWRSIPPPGELGAVGGKATRTTGTRKSRKAPNRRSFMERLEERWNRRRDDTGR